MTSRAADPLGFMRLRLPTLTLLLELFYFDSRLRPQKLFDSDSGLRLWPLDLLDSDSLLLPEDDKLLCRVCRGGHKDLGSHG